MSVGDSVVGGGQGRVVPQCFFEAFDAPPDTLFGAPVPEMAPSKVQLVRLRIDRPRLVGIQPLLLVRGELDLDFPRDGPRDFRLYLKHIVKTALVALSPQVRFVADPDELRGYAH